MQMIDHATVLDVLYAALGLGSLLAQNLWRVTRERNCCRELLRLEQQRNIAQQNETLRILSTAYASGEPTTLDDLLSSAERDFTLRSSRTPPAG